MDSLLEKYSMKTLGEYKADWGDSVETEISFYKTFLEKTDYVSSKCIEEYIQGKSKTQIVEKYGDLLDAREFARNKIRELEGE